MAGENVIYSKSNILSAKKNTALYPLRRLRASSPCNKGSLVGGAAILKEQLQDDQKRDAGDAEHTGDKAVDKIHGQ